MAVTVQHPATSTLIQEERANGVAILRLNRPEKMNALNLEMSRALVHAFLRAAEDKSVRAIVITGAGRAFCAGGDLAQIRDARKRNAGRELEGLLHAGKEICLAIAATPKLVLAAVNGVAAGAGMSLALACDLRVASESATFAQSFTQVGLYPDFGATYFLPRLVGLARASELFYTADTLSAAEARRIGIVCCVSGDAIFEDEWRKRANQLASGPPLAYRDIKHTMIGERRKELEAALDEEIRLQIHCFLSEDCAEGLAAFFEKRKPNFMGR
ncbi:MAG TPA: enoyl-CoA hydratase-related protein [Candidatus Acidoferrum sp.]|nr:enoyl-CoA hydratase-related protein [Candidatus Acidoferrum sp.]